MMRWFLPVIAVLLPLAGVIAPRAEEAQMVAEGHAIALKICAICHVVAADQAAPPKMNPPAPNFAEIAQRSNVTEPFLRDFLMKPHGEARALSAMPAFLMSDRQADAAIAYLLSLKPRP
jgi:mono/diheme cytochrome c family protein